MSFSSLSGLLNPEAVTQAMSKSLDEWQTIFEKSIQSAPGSEQKMDEILAEVHAANTSGNMRDNSFFSLISNLLTLIGAWLMLRLRKAGFHFYLIGIIISVIAPLLVFGSDNFLGFSYAFFEGILGAVFTLLYALRIKYMH